MEDNMKNKPKMYQNKITKEIHNNQSVFSGIGNKQPINNIRNKINTIIKGSDFIYSKKVYIVFDNTTIKRNIIGISGNSIVTIDNEYIPIDNITDIYT